VPFEHLSYNLTPFDIQNEVKVKLEIPQLGTITVTARSGTTNFGEFSQFRKRKQLQQKV